MNDAANALPADERPLGPPAPAGGRPAWLVNSEQVVAGEPRENQAGAPPEPLRLTTARDLSTSAPIDRPLAPGRPNPVPAKAESGKLAGPVAWTAAASSIPKLKITPPPAPAAVPGPVAARTREIEPDFDEAETGDGFPDDPLDSRSAPPAPVRKLDEPVWVVALDELRSNSRVQIIALAVVLVPLLTFFLWPRSEPGVSLHELRNSPARWDGQQVRLSGRVADVFHVGAGCAFNLVQGRDTIVVFTRGAAPRMRDKISVVGSVSTGYLDGQPRQAIFATP